MRCVVLGARGQVGRALCQTLAASGHRVHALNRDELDCTDLDALRRWLHKQAPQVVFNAAAYTAVDQAENEPELATRVNTDLPAMLAGLSGAGDFSLVHYSTDYVYPGEGEHPYSEDSTPGPLSVYGKTKLAGDQAVIAQDANALIARTSWVYDAHGKNFLNTMLKLANDRSELQVVDDQIGTPTSADFIAQTSVQLQAMGAKGIYHVVPRGYTSWAGFAEMTFTLTGQSVTVHKIPSSAYPTPARRPLNSRLATYKLEQALHCRLPPWQALLAETLGVSWTDTSQTV